MIDHHLQIFSYYFFLINYFIGGVTRRICSFLIFALALLPHLIRGQETMPTTDDEGSIQRLNYGVLFQKQPDLYLDFG